METLTMTETGSTTTMHMHVHQDGPIPTLEEQANQLHLQQQQQLVTLGNMGNINHGLHEDIVSIPKEVMLISLVSQEQALYNPKHEYYRNTHRKDAKWLEISDTVGWTEAQCKSKWKAMRDQYCRELKRSKFNTKANVKWKYFKELEFLRPFALSRNYRPRATNKNENSTASNGKNTCHKLPSIKMENGQFTTCDFSADSNVLDADDKLDTTTTRLLTSLSDEQLNSVMQQHSSSWNYLTTTTTTTTSGVHTLQGNEHSPNELDDTNLLQHSQQHSEADDMLCALVESVPSAAQLQQTQSHNEEEDDDPIHTFLNMESFFEKDLISMIQQEDIIYNNFHPNYRNAKLKLEVWDEIARKLKKPVGRCRLKWKALRDQYIREHKRLKDRENSESLPRWKHYDALTFLQKFIKHKTSESDSKNVVQLPKTELDTDIDEQMIDSPPLASPIEVVQHDLEQQALPTLTGPHSQHELHSTTHDICVVSGSSVSGYDEMDIDHYIIGHASDAGANDDGIGMDAHDDEEDRKPHQHFAEFATSSASNMTANNNSNQQDNGNDVKPEEHEFKDIKESNMMTQQAVVSLQNQLQLQQQQQQQQQELSPQSHHQPHPQMLLTPQHQQPPLLKLTSQTTTHLHQPPPNLLSLDVGGEPNTATLNTSDKTILQLQNQQQPQSQPQQQQQQHDFSNDMKQQQQQCQQTLTSGLVHSVSPNLPSNNNKCTNVLSGMAILNSSGSSLSMEALNLQSLTHISHISSTPTTTATTTTAMHAVPTPVTAASMPTADQHQRTTTDNVGDDEVGAFFKAVAMKIRNANMSPVAFTDLQIDILRVINGTLRHN
ncbi:uncharacterized protein Adf1_46 [Zeugodacus cucurbitae]|uniref:uncharacterized protein Adf1_46 n=1 Tax=Zeugodacus cucurbitae TaxID=28588 RepID=UPI0023D95467|nr:uncharacterized protein Adf1_46 [Zeugodacus cucurbitae]